MAMLIDSKFESWTEHETEKILKNLTVDSSFPKLKAYPFIILIC